MAFALEINYQKQIRTQKNRDATFAFLTDFDESIGKTFPGLKTFRQVAPLTYRWVFEKITYAAYEIEINLHTKFLIEPLTRVYVISTAEKGMSFLEAEWLFPSNDFEQGEISFRATLKGEMPFPSLLRSVVAPLIQKELTKLFDQYVLHVEEALRQ